MIEIELKDKHIVLTESFMDNVGRISLSKEVQYKTVDKKHPYFTLNIKDHKGVYLDMFMINNWDDAVLLYNTILRFIEKKEGVAK